MARNCFPPSGKARVVDAIFTRHPTEIFINAGLTDGIARRVPADGITTPRRKDRFNAARQPRWAAGEIALPLKTPLQSGLKRPGTA